MKVSAIPLNIVSRIAKGVDPSSLQFRLTVGVTTVAIVGLGSLAVWTSLRMQQILITGHKQNAIGIEQRFAEDVTLYREMMPLQIALQRAIDNRTTSNLVIWVKQTDGITAAQSEMLSSPSWQNDGTTSELIAITDAFMAPGIQPINDRYMVVCASLLKIDGEEIGTLYMANDVTQDQNSFFAILRSLAIASTLAITSIVILIAIYVRRSLRPLRDLSQLADTISADDLDAVQLQLDQAPSEVQELAQMLNQMLGRLSASWEQQRQFVSDVSHELRTPLTLVHGYLQSTLRRGQNLTEVQREGLETAVSEADRTIALLQDLLDLARADNGYLRFRSEPIVLKDLVAEVVGMAQQFNDRVVVKGDQAPIEVKGDHHRLKQVLINLIDNAVKYSDPDQPITLKLNHTGRFAAIQICDRSPGIPLQHQARIFERFYRVDDARSRATGGTGLGLSIVKTLVEGMGGQVSVRSKLNYGSEFTVTLPTF